MLLVECYVRSCGGGPEHGYCWIHFAPEQQYRIESTILTTLQCYDLIEHEAFSLGIERGGDQLALIITGLKASRGDYQHRSITHSLAFRAPARQESTIRAIAAAALRGELEQMVDYAIQRDTQPGGVGFVVHPALLDAMPSRAAGQAEPFPQEGRIGKNTTRLRLGLAHELNTHSLPSRSGPLVVVTRNTDPGRLRMANVWRGLSRLFDTERDDDECEWQEMYRVPLNLQGKDLRYADLQGLDLRYANFSRSDLRYANLSRSDLRHANLSQTNLAHANLSGADLRDTKFWPAWHFFAKFRGAIGNRETRWPLLIPPFGAVNVDRQIGRRNDQPARKQ